MARSTEIGERPAVGRERNGDSYRASKVEEWFLLRNAAANTFRGLPTAFPNPQGEEEERGSSYLLLTYQPA
jgi:hypothetical protein